MRNYKSIAITLLSILCSLTGWTQEIHVPHLALKNLFFESPNPLAQDWDDIPEETIILFPQNITTPSIHKASVAGLKVKALHNNKWLAIYLEWEDKTKDAQVSLDQASDACAVQFPLKEPEKTSPFMGNKEFPVAILHWKAIWQQDIEDHYQEVKDLYPNTYVETYQFGIQAAADLQNPVSQLKRKVPVEELMAEGFGTLTTQAEQGTQAKGIFKEGHWLVVLARPLKTKDKMDPRLAVGQKTAISFAIWEGAHKNVGARKNYAPWISFILESSK